MAEAHEPNATTPPLPRGKQRLDLLLVERGLAESREQARRLIMAGEVMVDNQVSDKPGRTVGRDVELRVTPQGLRARVTLPAA